jgi:tetratricopeptide (TPR) repeat protein
MKELKEIPGFISYLIFHWIAMGQLQKLWTSKQYSELVSFCDLMFTKNPTDYLAFYYRGLANEKLNRFESAIDDLIRSEAALNTYKLKTLLKDYFIRIPIQLSRVYRKSQDNERALTYANKAVQVDSEEIEGLKWRASLKVDFGDYVGASEDLNDALRRRPKDKSLVKLRDRLTYSIIEDRKQRAKR